MRLFPALRFADLDLDGFQDLTLSITINGASKTFVYKSMSCDEQKLKDLQTDVKHCRYFDSSIYGNDLTKDMRDQNALASTHFDFGERGKMGFLAFEKSKVNKLKIAGYINNIETDFYFLKAIGFGNSKEFHSLNGATFLIERSTDSENQHVFSRTQSTHCSFSTLCLPYVHFGLAKINNYVQYFQAGINIDAMDGPYTRHWSPIIPNSQLIVYTEPAKSYDFKMNIFINPTSAMLLIFISTIVVLVIIGAIVIYLHVKEKKLDSRFRMDDNNFFF